MLWPIVFSSLGVLSIIYYAALCMKLKKWDSTFSRFWLICGIAGLCLGRLFKRGFGFPADILLKGLLVVLAVAFVLTEVRIIRGMFPDRQFAKEQEDYRYLIVLGAQVDGTRITDSLRRRLDRAVRYLTEHSGTVVIVSGGRGKGEEIAEAWVMAEYLKAHGIEEERILREDRSRTTKENLEFSKAYIEDLGVPIGIVSNDFHLYRAVCYAKRQGYFLPCPVAAECHPLLFPNYIVREFFAVWKMWIVS